MTSIWSCLPAAASKVFDVPFDKLIEAIGHDGSRIFDPNLPDPFCREGFTVQEIVKGLLKLGVLVCSYELYHNTPEGETVPLYKDISKFLQKDRLFLFGIVYEQPHATAYIDGVIDDPSGAVYPLEDFKVIAIVERIDECTRRLLD